MLAFFDLTRGAKDGFRTPTGFRLVDQEDAYLAYGNGGPRVCMQVDDFSSLNTGTPNRPVEVRNYSTVSRAP